MHLNDPGTLIHRAFIPHALARAHSFMSKHSCMGGPENPDGHSQLKLPLMLMHFAEEPQGLLIHSSKSGFNRLIGLDL